MPERMLTQFAAESGSQEGVLEALGIEWQMLLFQIIGFLVLVWLMGKFVYPILMRAVDSRQAKIEESVKAADTAKEKAEKAEQEIERLLAEARREAKEILVTAKDEATASIEAAEKKAVAKAEKIVASGHEQIEKDVLAAKKTLHNETLELIAEATERVLGKKVDSATDRSLIADSVKEVR